MHTETLHTQYSSASWRKSLLVRTASSSSFINVELSTGAKNNHIASYRYILTSGYADNYITAQLTNICVANNYA